MNAIKMILNVLGILLAIPVTLFLALWLVCVPMVSAASGWVQEETIKQMIRDVDYSAFLEGEDAEDEMLLQVMRTEAVTSIVELFVDDMFAQLEGAAVGSVCTEQAVRDCVEAHMDELVAVIRDMLATDENMDVTQLTDEEIVKYIRDSLYPEIPELLENLPKIEDLYAEMGIDVQAAQMGMQMLHGGILTSFAIGLAVVLTLVLFVLRLYRLRGLIWLSVVYFLNAGFALLLNQGVKLAVLELTAEELLVKPLMDSLADTLMHSSIIYGVVAIVCVVAAVLFHNYLVNRHVPRPENVGPELY